MSNTLLLKSRQSDATEPGATALKVGELAVNTFDGRVYLGTDLSGTASRSAGGAATASTPVGAPILDQDNMSSDSATSLATQQSIKKYVDDEILANAGTGDITGVTLAGDSGSASDTSANVDLTIAGGSGITTSATGTTVTVAGDNASTSAKGVASFSSDNFAVSSGAVTIKDDGVATAEIQDDAVTLAKMAAITRGSIIVGGGSNAPTALAAKTDGQILVGDGTDLASVAVSGDVTLANDGTTTIGTGTVHHAMLSDDIISGQDALTSGLASTDELAISDAGTVKRMDVSVLQSYLQSNLTFTTNTDADVSNANLLTRLANLESSGGTGDENITIGTDSGDTIVITGNLQVSGTTTTVNSTTVNLNDHNIVLDSGNSTSAVVNGAGITLEGGSGDDATFTYSTTGPQFEMKLGSSYEDLQVAKLTAASLDISGDVDVDGTLEADAITVNGTALAESISDTVGAMFSSNTETGITATYQDADNTIDLVIGAGDIVHSMLADDAVDADNLASNAVVTASIVDNAVTLAKMAGLARGNIILGDSSGDPSALDASTSGQILVGDGNDLASVAVSGDVTLSNSGVTTIGSGTVHHAMLNDDIISGQDALTSGLASTDEFAISDAGTVKRMDVSVLSAYTAALSETLTNKTISGGAYST